MMRVPASVEVDQDSYSDWTTLLSLVACGWYVVGTIETIYRSKSHQKPIDTKKSQMNKPSFLINAFFKCIRMMIAALRFGMRPNPVMRSIKTDQHI